MQSATRLSEKVMMPFRERKAVARAQLPSASELQRHYLSAVFHYVSGRIGSGMEAEDIVAEVFGAAFASISACPRRSSVSQNGDDPVRAWLFGIARRKVADAYRRRSRHSAIDLKPDLPAPIGDSPEVRALADEAARTLQAILEELPEMQREALLLKYREELSLEEIGHILRKSPKAVGQLLHRARQAVRRRGILYFVELDEKGEAGK